MSITNPRVGARVTAQNTTASGTDANITPDLPASLVDGDLLVCCDAVFRNLENRSQSNASTPATPTGWTRKATTVALGGPKTGTGASAYHSSMRLTWYYTRYQSSGSGGVNTAPSITYGPTAVTTDWHSAQIIAFTGALAAGDPTDVLGAFTALDASLAVAAAASTSTLGPATAATATGAGGVALVALSGEYPLSTGTVPTLAGDSLTWTEASEYGAGGTDAHTLAIDYALLPTAASVTDKSAAVTFGTAAKSIGQMWLIAPDPTAGAAVSMTGASTLTAGASAANSGGAAITAVGTVYTSGGTGTTTLAVTPVTAGNCLVLAVTAYGDATRTVSSVTGGGATGWTRIAGPHNYTGSLDRQELWLGTVTTAGASTITVTWSNSVASADCHNNAQEFTSGGGPGTTWARDGAGATSNNASSATLTFPTLTPAGTGRCYVGRLVTGNVPTAGSQTAGYTMTVDNFTNAYLYKVSVSTAQNPTATQSAASTSGGVAALLTATNFVTYPGGAALAGDSSLTAGATRTAVSASAMAAAGSLTTAGTYTALPATTLAATASLTAGAVRDQPGAVAMAGASSLAAAGTRAVAPTVALAATASLAATGVAGTSVILAATTTLNAGATYTALPAVALSGASGLAVATVPTRPAAVTLAGSAVLAAGVARTATVAVTLTAATTLIAATSPRAILAATTTFTAGARATRYPTVALTATAALIARVELTWLVPTTMGGFTSSAPVNTLGGLTRTVVSTSGGYTPDLVRAADHSHSSSVQIIRDTGRVLAVAALAGSSSLTVAAGRVAVGGAVMAANAMLVPNASGAGRATLTAVGSLTAGGVGVVNPTVALAGVTALTGAGTPLTPAAVTMTGASTLNAAATAGPTVPQNMTAVVNPDNSISLSWDAFPGASSYKLYEDQSLGGVSGAGALTTTSSVRTPGTSRTYNYWVTANVNSVETGASNHATAVLPYTAPPPPPGGGGTGGSPANVLRIDGVNGGAGGYWNEGIGFHSGDPEGFGHQDITYSSIAGGYTRAFYFTTTTAGDAVQFGVYCDGARTTTNTHYPRSELRELQSDGSTKASWSGSSGTHTMSGTTRVTHGVSARDKVVIAQIHDGTQDTLQIAVDGTDVTLSIIGVQKGTMLAGVSKGTWFDWECKVTNGTVTVKINGVQKYNSNPGYGSGQYFKAGCYGQAASGYTSGVSASDYFTIELKNLATSHS